MSSQEFATVLASRWQDQIPGLDQRPDIGIEEIPLGS